MSIANKHIVNSNTNVKVWYRLDLKNNTVKISHTQFMNGHYYSFNFIIILCI